jgi:hypothetical protein
MTRVSNEVLLEKIENIICVQSDMKKDVHIIKKELSNNNEDTKRLMRKVITGNGEKPLLERVGLIERYIIVFFILELMIIGWIGHKTLFPMLFNMILK